MRKILFGMLFVILLISFSISSFAAIQEIEIFDTGDAFIEGTAETDILDEVSLDNGIVRGYTWEFVEKKGSEWMFSYRMPLQHEYDIYVKFPEGSELTSFDTSGEISITSLGDSPVVHLVGNESLDVEIGYTLGEREETNYLWVIPILILFLVLLVLRYLPKTRKSKLDIEKLNTVKLTLNENQLQIIEALLQKKGEASQTTIRHLSGLPKSSLSRNIELLAQKDVVAKYSAGNSNYIKLHPRFYK